MVGRGCLLLNESIVYFFFCLGEEIVVKDGVRRRRYS